MEEDSLGGEAEQLAPTSGVAAWEPRPCAARPVYKLSVNLINTYKLINREYYKARKVAPKGGAGRGRGGVFNHGYDDENYDYIMEPTEDWGRYLVQGKPPIGKGSFGKVYKAEDKNSGASVALKVIKSKQPFTQQAKAEIEILKLINQKDPEGKYNCCKLLDTFVYRDHQCLVFEILGVNLFEVIRSTHFEGCSLVLIRKFARGILKALSFLAHPEVNIIHCDLKPENILLCRSRRSDVKIIDFGSSCRGDQQVFTYIQSRFYRSPEVMLGLNYTCAIDMWSFGCILMELHTGEPLFPGRDQFDQICYVIATLGMPPDDLLSRAQPQHRSQFFEVVSEGGGSTCELPQPYQPSGSYQIRPHRLQQRIKDAEKKGGKDASKFDENQRSLTDILSSRKRGRWEGHTRGQEESHIQSFEDLIRKTLAYRPEERITPMQALQHPFMA